MDELSPRALNFLVAAILYADEARSAAYRIPSLVGEITQGLKLNGADAGAAAPRASADEVLAWLERREAL
ncbi:MAG TPA: hypothetical protein VL460_12070 [Caulobacteraceae bacterium]|jgi:hypothetical protein|nr:hypothetical protein [Caulobacteraceae bacterium]